MKILIIAATMFLSGCNIVANGSQLQQHKNDCEAYTKTTCSAVFMPDTVPDNELRELMDKYKN